MSEFVADWSLSSSEKDAENENGRSNDYSLADEFFNEKSRVSRLQSVYDPSASGVIAVLFGSSSAVNATVSPQS